MIEHNILASLKELLVFLRKETAPQSDLPRIYEQEVIQTASPI